MATIDTLPVAREQARAKVKGGLDVLSEINDVRLQIAELLKDDEILDLRRTALEKLDTGLDQALSDIKAAPTTATSKIDHLIQSIPATAGADVNQAFFKDLKAALMIHRDVANAQKINPLITAARIAKRIKESVTANQERKKLAEQEIVKKIPTTMVKLPQSIESLRTTKTDLVSFGKGIVDDITKTDAEVIKIEGEISAIHATVEIPEARRIEIRNAVRADIEAKKAALEPEMLRQLDSLDEGALKGLEIQERGIMNDEDPEYVRRLDAERNTLLASAVLDQKRKLEDKKTSLLAQKANKVAELSAIVHLCQSFDAADTELKKYEFNTTGTPAEQVKKRLELFKTLQIPEAIGHFNAVLKEDPRAAELAIADAETYLKKQ